MEIGPDGESTEESEEDHIDSDEEQHDMRNHIISRMGSYTSDSGCSLFSSSDESIIWTCTNIFERLIFTHDPEDKLVELWIKVYPYNNLSQERLITVINLDFIRILWFNSK